MIEPAEHKKTVVIIEDDDDLLTMLSFAFKAEGFIVKGISSGKEGIEYLSDEKNVTEICLIILDRMLPDMDGVDILKQFYDKFRKDIPIMILSVLSGERDVLTGIKEGAIEYVTKPFSLPILLQKAQALISRFK